MTTTMSEADRLYAQMLQDEDAELLAGGRDDDADPQYAAEAPQTCGREWYYRVQPAGASIFGHTSQTSNGWLRDGYIFAYESADALMSGQLEWGLYGTEVVAFEGNRRYQPGDAEGVAIEPWIERKRWTVAEFARTRRGELARRFRQMVGC